MLKMVKFYRLDREQVIDTITDIPQEQWEKKQILPYRLNTIDIEKGTTTDIVEGLEIKTNEVVKTEINWIEPFNLETYKLNKIENLKINTLTHTYTKVPQHKRDQINNQQNGFDWGLSQTYIDDTLTWLRKHKEEIDLIEARILSATTKEEIDLETDCVKVV